MASDATTGQLTGAAAEVYERCFVPALFAQWCEPMLDAARAGPGRSVLDVGCGTGVLARAAAARTGPEHVAGVDRNDGMLAVARRIAPAVRWVHAPAERLPLPDDAFDAAVCQFALMFFDDRAAALREMARTVRSGGRVVLATWCAVEESPGYDAMVRLLDRHVGSSAADALRAPFVLGTAAAVHDLVAPHLGPVDVRRVGGTARFPSLDEWVRTDVRGWTLADRIDDEQEAVLRAAAHRDLAAFVAPDGRVEFPAPALIASATVE